MVFESHAAGAQKQISGKSRVTILWLHVFVSAFSRQDHIFPAGSRAQSDVFGSFAFGRLGILLLRLNFPEFVAILDGGFKALQRFFGIVTHRGQGQGPVLNPEKGPDNLADAAGTL